MPKKFELPGIFKAELQIITHDLDYARSYRPTLTIHFSISYRFHIVGLCPIKICSNFA